MHVGLNLLFLVPGETGGTEVVARELIPELVAAAPHLRFTAFVNRVPQGKVDVVPYGVGTTPRAEPLPVSEVRARLRARERPIVLCVAAKRPHKNLVRLLGALALTPVPGRPLLVIPGYPTAHERDL